MEGLAGASAGEARAAVGGAARDAGGIEVGVEAYSLVLVSPLLVEYLEIVSTFSIYNSS